jgi:hypothetical protein
MRVGIIGCSKTKLERPAPARELYCSRTFRAAKAWMDKRMPWVILSAKYGVVEPGDVLEPYDLCLQSLSQRDRQAWNERCQSDLMRRFNVSETVFTTILGVEYMAPLRDFPYVENYIQALKACRENHGMRGRAAAVSIGVLYKALAAGQELGA